MKTIRVAAAIVKEDNQILVAKRNYGEFKGYWEFPGGKYEENETGFKALRREMQEEFEVDICNPDYYFTIEHDYANFHLIMDCYTCELVDDNLELHDHSEIKWIDPYDNDIDLLPADEKVIEMYRKRLEERSDGVY